MSALLAWIDSLHPGAIALLAAILATLGWLYTSRRNRALSRKQHTFDALLTSGFNAEFQKHRDTIRQYVVDGNFPDNLEDSHEDVFRALKFVLNYYEFISAGVRSGDI